MRQVEAGGIGRRIARARKERGLTQEELAALIGVSPRSIQGYEAGSVVPYRRLARLAAVCNRDIGWLLEGDTNTDHELVERLLYAVEELSAQASRIGAIAERLEYLLGAANGQLRDADGRDSET
jgi:transcriptional regulator with XRE-family HTH domain